MTPTQKALVKQLALVGPLPHEIITERDLMPRRVVQLAADWARIAQDELLMPCRLPDVLARRWLVIFALRCRFMYLTSLGVTGNASKANCYSFSGIGRLLFMDHTSIMHATKNTLNTMRNHTAVLYEFYKQLEQK